MTQTASAFAPILGQAAGAGIGALFGDDAPSNLGIKAGGLRARITSGGTAKVNVRPERTAIVQGLANQFRDIGAQIGGLRERVGPGFQNVLESRLNTLRSARSRTVGTIAENLSRRRVLGSSFGQAAIAQTEREFAEAEANARAQTFLEGIQTEQNLIQTEGAALIDAFQTELNEQNLQIQVASGLMGQTIQAQTQNSLLQQQLAAQAASGFGAFGAQLGGALGDIFQGGGNPFTTDSAGRILGGI